ncbi:hypothetical protein HK104_006982 [Borealophlyctis nickersoniae]|nr:hypothetical protein HK104_006982 [Borealophlyctis nickersoniae]
MPAPEVLIVNTGGKLKTPEYLNNEAKLETPEYYFWEDHNVKYRPVPAAVEQGNDERTDDTNTDPHVGTSDSGGRIPDAGCGSNDACPVVVDGPENRWDACPIREA